MRGVHIINKRLKYLGVVYLIGVIVSINHTGVPEWYYLIPFKLIAICLMLVGGNAIYYIAEEKIPFLLAFWRSLKYLLISFAILILFAFFLIAGETVKI